MPFIIHLHKYPVNKTRKEEAMFQLKRNIAIIGILIIFACTLFLTGCGAGKTTVVSLTDTYAKFTRAEIFEEKSTVHVPEQVKTQFKGALEKELFEKGGFVRGDGLKIMYRFVQFNPGSQFSRWFWGGIGSAGKGSMTVEARFLKFDGTELAKINAEGEISSGAFGGSFNLAIQKAAKEIAEYAKRYR
jgi:hypothetical protein